MSVEVVVLYSHTNFYYFHLGDWNPINVMKFVNLPFVIWTPPRVHIWPWNMDMEYWLGGVDETYDFVSIGKEDAQT